MRKLIGFLAATLFIAAPVLATEHNADPTFANTSYFTLATGWTHPAGKLTGTAVQAQRAFVADSSIHDGDVIHYSITVSNWTAGSLQLAFGPTKASVAGTNILAASTAGAPDIADNFNNTLSATAATSAVFNQIGPDSAFRFFTARPATVGVFDPIVAPGLPGQGHLHTFYCNTGVNPYSTYQTLRTSGGTNCGNPQYPANRSSYWQPAMLDGQGHVVLPFYTLFYYKGHNPAHSYCGFPDATHLGICITIPNGLRYVAGYNMATMSGGGTQGEPFWFNCLDATVPGSADNTGNGNIMTFGGVQRFNTMKDLYTAGCRSTSAGKVVIFSTAEAPTCWDGVHLDVPDHRSHMHYQDGPVISITWTDIAGTHTSNSPSCPTTHPYLVPSFSILNFYIANPAWDLGLWRLSSDEQMSPAVDAGTTLHQDYFEGWSPTIKARWTAHCTNEDRNCESGDLGDGYTLGSYRSSYDGAKTTTTLPLTRFGYSRLLKGNGTFTGEVTAKYGGGFFLFSPDGFSGDITALSITDVTKSGNHAPITVHGSKS